ncbi:MAG TPA: glutathione S-transferase [Burkholderiaceae bacterium]
MDASAAAASRAAGIPLAVGERPHDAPAAMSDYELYYWPMPFRGQFIRAILAHAGKRWDEYAADDIAATMHAAPDAQPVPFMGPPMLHDRRAGVWLAQMPAIAYYLAETLDLLPRKVALQALALKVVNDANDVIDELTLDGGRQMWTPRRWKEHVPRLRRWMAIWESTGRRHGLAADAGCLLGGARVGVADPVTATLWDTMSERFPVIGELLDDEAPRVAGLTRRVCALPSIANLRAQTRARFGDAYCGGRIERSMRQVIR